MRPKESFIIISGAQLGNRTILFNGITCAQKIRLSSRRLILGIFIRNLKLEYFALNPNIFVIVKILVEKIISLSKQIGVINTIGHFFAYKAYFESLSEVNSSGLSIQMLDDERPMWVSRVAALKGVAPYSLSHSQEYDFARFQTKFSGFIWDIHVQKDKSSPRTSLPESPRRGSEVELCHLDPDSKLSFNALQDASIFHGRTVICDGFVIPTDLYNFTDGSWPSDFVFKRNDKYFLFGTELDPVFFADKSVFFGTSTSWFHFLIEVFPRYLKYDRNELRNRTPVLEQGIPPQIVEVLQLVTNHQPIILNSFQKAVFQDLIVCTEARYPLGLDLFRRSDDIQLVRSFFSSLFALANVQKSELVFITRNRDLFRRSDIVHSLAESCSGLGFVVIDSGQLSMRKQIELFSSARLIVAETGSSLTNLVFCHPGTTVIEINLHGFMKDFFKDFCNVLDLQHFEVNEIFSSELGFSLNIGGEDIEFTTFLDSVWKDSNSST